MPELKSLYNDISKHIANRAEDSRHQLIVFGIVMFIYFPLYYAIWLLTLSNTYENLGLRLLASLFCIPLIFKNYWPQKLVKFLPIYWYLTVLYCLPFFFTFMLLKNQGATIWLMNSVSALFFVLLLFDVASAIILITVGALVAWLCYKLTTTTVFVFSPGDINWTGVIVSFLAAFVIGAIFSHNKQKLEQEQLKAMAAVGGSIAHELRTPLLAIDSGVTGLKKYFPVLFETYQYAIKNGWPSQEVIRPDRFEALLTVLDDITAETQYSNVIIDMLLQKVNTHLQAGELKICSIRDCIDDALRRYPFQTNSHYDLITWTDANNFKFRGSHLLIVHVLFNLFKNALFFIEDAGKGHIFIWTETGEKTHTLHFKDTAKGIAPSVLSHLFKRFYSTTLNGTGLGLAFCKMVMTGIGGDIICVSNEGEYAEFIMTFPKVDYN